MATDTQATFHALLVEGIPGIGKTTLIDALLRRHVAAAGARQVRTLVYLSQTHTYGPLAPGEDAGTLTVHDNLAHLEQIVRMVEWLRAGVQQQTRPACFVLIDTLHLTHCVRPGVLTWADAAPFDRRLAAAGCKLLVLQAAAEVVWQRAIEARADWPFLREYAAKFGSTHEELHDYFMSEQTAFARMYEQTALPKLLCANDATLAEIVDRADEFWRGGAQRAAERGA